jgi:hypothetical protein
LTLFDSKTFLMASASSSEKDGHGANVG